MQDFIHIFTIIVEFCNCPWRENLLILLLFERRQVEIEDRLVSTLAIFERKEGLVSAQRGLLTKYQGVSKSPASFVPSKTNPLILFSSKSNLVKRSHYRLFLYVYKKVIVTELFGCVELCVPYILCLRRCVRTSCPNWSHWRMWRISCSSASSTSPVSWRSGSGVLASLLYAVQIILKFLLGPPSPA